MIHINTRHRVDEHYSPVLEPYGLEDTWLLLPAPSKVQRGVNEDSTGLLPFYEGLGENKPQGSQGGSVVNRPGSRWGPPEGSDGSPSMDRWSLGGPPNHFSVSTSSSVR